jgi:hypothetical protein
MDLGKVFVLILTLLAVGVLVYLEMKSRRARRELQEGEAENHGSTKKTAGKY